MTEEIKKPRLTKAEYDKMPQAEQQAHERKLREELIASGVVRPAPEPEKPIKIKVLATGK